MLGSKINERASMANHARAQLPWGVDSTLMELFAATAMQAAFGGYYVVDSEKDYGPLSFSRLEPSTGRPFGGMTTQVWSESPRHVEMRHGCQGLDRVAQALEFDAICSCFGAPIANDDGIGDYLLGQPGACFLLPMRFMDGGLAEVESPFEKKRKSAAGAQPTWLLGPGELPTAQAMLDPIFFDAPAIDRRAIYTPGPERENYLRQKAKDVLRWGPKLDWAGAVESAHPGGAGLDAKSAGAALLPSAALDIAFAPCALAKASVAGLERALAVAALWSNAGAASSLHARLAEVSSDASVSLAKAQAHCDKFLRRRGKTREGDPVAHQAAAAASIFDALALSTAAPRPAAPKAVKSTRSI
jgi:hypothetical protein